MRKILFVVLVAWAVLAAASCTNSPTSPGAVSATPAKSVSPEPGPGATIDLNDLMGTWEATKAEAWRFAWEGNGFVEVAGSRRDLVADGGTVTLVLEPNSQALGNSVPPGKYAITVSMPGGKSGVDTGFWFCGRIIGGGGPITGAQFQIDFYPASIFPDPDYGDVPAFLAALNGDTLRLWDSGMSFLPFDFGWDRWSTVLDLVFTRK